MIRHWLRAAFLAVGLSAAALAAQAQAPKSFVREDLASQVVRLEQTFKSEGARLIGSKTGPQRPPEGGARARAPKSFVREDLPSRVVRLEQTFKSEGARLIGSKTGPQLRQEGEALLRNGQARQAASLLTSAVAAEPANAAN